MEFDNTRKVIYRFKFTPQFLNELYEFAKIHQYDNRKEFKNQWNIWKINNINIITAEESLLNKNGYTGDINKKMYTSVRYYLKDKQIIPNEPIERCSYITINKDILFLMDEHIKNNINVKPSILFAEFMDNNQDLIFKENQIISREYNINFNKKINKTYKNRYYMITHKK